MEKEGARRGAMSENNCNCPPKGMHPRKEALNGQWGGGVGVWAILEPSPQKKQWRGVKKITKAVR